MIRKPRQIAKTVNPQQSAHTPVSHMGIAPLLAGTRLNQQKTGHSLARPTRSALALFGPIV